MTGSSDLLFPQDLEATGHKSGFVAVVGAPNTGKSSLINALMGQRLAIVSSKPQTTRHQMLAILTKPEAQIIFVDTPGIHRPEHELGRYMVEVAQAAIEDADVAIWLVDASHDPNQADQAVAEALSGVEALPVALVVNKTDLVDEVTLRERRSTYEALVQAEAVFSISVTEGKGLEKLLQWIIGTLPAGPRYYPEDQVTDREERFLAAELIREQALLHLRHEVPHAIAVSLDEFKERPNGTTYIAATIYVEKESQKGIVIGTKGVTLKTISTAARLEIEKALQRSVYLDVWVKVRKNWRRSAAALKRLGYRSPRQAE